jgi:hypothetical protein
VADDDTSQIRHIAVAIGILDDKIKNTKGIATSRSERTVKLPSKEEFAELLSGFGAQTQNEAAERQAVINESDIVVEQLPSADSTA